MALGESERILVLFNMYEFNMPRLHRTFGVKMDKEKGKKVRVDTHSAQLNQLALGLHTETLRSLHCSTPFSALATHANPTRLARLGTVRVWLPCAL